MRKQIRTRLMEPVLLALVLTALSSSEGQAATRTAASCSRADVQTAVNAAVDGDTVIIPSGACTWTTGITTNKQITITGLVKGTVLITHSAGSGDLFALTTGASFSTKVSNITFLAGSGTGRYLLISGSGRPPIIHDNYFRVPDFQLFQCMTLLRNGAVIHRNVFESLTVKGGGGSGGAGSGCLQIKVGSGSSWSTASTMGAADTTGTANVYIEDNIFTNIYLQAIDCDDNARTVIRFNTFNDSGFVCHGADTSPTGARHTELYNNTFIFHPSGVINGVPFPLNLNRWWYVRGGTGVATDNIMADITSGMWGAKPEIQLTVQQLRRNAGPNACCNTYPCLHQIGQSHNGSSLTTEPLYIWNNTGTGTPQSPGLADYEPNECPGNNRTATWVQQGRDYVIGPKPGYAKYTYPHPLASPGGVPAPPTAVRILR
jgi:hypothetical protein